MDKVYEGTYEDVIQSGDHLYIRSKKDKVCILPYTLDSKNLIDKIGIIEDWNDIEEEEYQTLLNDYIKTDDETDLVAANRILFDIIGTNVSDASRWMYLGTVYNSINSESPLKLYAVNITDMNIRSNEDVNDQDERRKFEMLDSSEVLQSDDLLFLGSFLRLFSYFYTTSLNNS